MKENLKKSMVVNQKLKWKVFQFILNLKVPPISIFKSSASKFKSRMSDVWILKLLSQRLKKSLGIQETLSKQFYILFVLWVKNSFQLFLLYFFDHQIFSSLTFFFHLLVFCPPFFLTSSLTKKRREKYFTLKPALLSKSTHCWVWWSYCRLSDFNFLFLSNEQTRGFKDKAKKIKIKEEKCKKRRKMKKIK